ncbi:hypothetical protein H4R21_006806, partial [Coemansia helicoidea]
VLPADTTMFYIARADICYDTRAIQAAIFAVLWATWAGIAVLSWQIRNIKSSFNESRESVIACVAELFVLTFITVLHYTKPGFALHLVFRILSTSTDHLVINLFWWTIMGVPLFNCLFRRQQYLALWVAKLCEDGLHRQYDVPSREQSKPSTVIRRPPTSLPAPVHPSEFYYADPHELPLDAGFPRFSPAFCAHDPSSTDNKKRHNLPHTLAAFSNSIDDLLSRPASRPAAEKPAKKQFW